LPLSHPPRRVGASLTLRSFLRDFFCITEVVSDVVCNDVSCADLTKTVAIFKTTIALQCLQEKDSRLARQLLVKCDYRAAQSAKSKEFKASQR
jgi:hypothetical protein